MLEAYLDLLKENKARADKIATLAAVEPELDLAIPDFTKEAWNALKAGGRLPASRAAIPFSPRSDGCDRPVPNAVLKVPTGGGKTWLAVSAVSRILSRYLDQNTGFVLWIVPNEAIYTQTLKHMRTANTRIGRRLTAQLPAAFESWRKPIVLTHATWKHIFASC